MEDSEGGCVKKGCVLMGKTKVKVIIPTYNAGEKFKNVLFMLAKQKGLAKNDIMIIDSSSTDNTQDIVKSFGFQLIVISKAEFGHGKTRNYATKLAGDVDFLVFMTQDALLYDEESVANLIGYFEKDKSIAAVYGRQVPYEHTDIFGKHARLFNYPKQSSVKVLADKKRYGLKTAFFSDTFAAYKKEIFDRLGMFQEVNFGEDTCMAAKMLLAGYKIGYCAEAQVFHSHTFSIIDDFRRCSEIGKFHKQEHWLLDEFGKAEGEGLRFVKSQVKYLLSNGKWYLLPELVVRNGMKYLGYRLG